MRALARAKINLFLHVVGRRADGYHLLESLVAFAECHDAVTAAPGAGLSLTVGGPMAERLGDALATEAQDNLVLRAAARLAEAAGVPADAALALDKHLPVAAGIGGGSADAAAALRALMRLWDVTLPGPALQRLALGLGADVPVCLASAPTLMSGIGDVLTPVPPLPPTPLVLVNPGVSTPTGPVFQRRTGPFSAPLGLGAGAFVGLTDARALADRLAGFRNDLQPPAIALAPIVGTVLDRLSRTAGCLLARMSGSGATCFALYADAAHAADAASMIARDHSGWWVVATRLDAAPPSPQSL